MAGVLVLPGCTKVGPDFASPTAPVAPDWLEADGVTVTAEGADERAWWAVFNDPVLDRLIEQGYRGNLPLQVAGLRVLEARAQLGIAVGNQYPQSQAVRASLGYFRESERAAGSPQPGVNGAGFAFAEGSIGLAAAWELDFWGKFRRAIESADANLFASLAGYNDVLVLLSADVAATYVRARTFQQRLAIARDNVQTQREGLRIAEARFRNGATSERDVQQARTLLFATEATIPELETGLLQTRDALSVLLGRPPVPLEELLGPPAPIPEPPLTVAVGIPADLLRRRPDIRAAEAQAAAQSALIGVAKADLYPSVTLAGTLGLRAADVGRFDLSDIFLAKSWEGSFGPQVNWNFLNYGRLTNAVRVEDARFQQAIATYQDAVLQAQREVEDQLVAFVRSQLRVALRKDSAAAATRSTSLALLQYQEGATDFTTVLTALQDQLAEQDSLAVARGDIALALVGIFRALGGGWQVRLGDDPVPAAVRTEMAERTDWGTLLAPGAIPPAASVTGETVFRAPDW
jgi:NodT family efflux transporter outer membrane factor (OMF) lipoprotein